MKYKRYSIKDTNKSLILRIKRTKIQDFNQSNFNSSPKIICIEFKKYKLSKMINKWRRKIMKSKEKNC